MARALPALLAVMSLLFAVPARAKVGETYCVGGYAGTPPNVVAACAQPEVVKLHRRWHEHLYVTDGKECLLCYDEEDQTCETVFLARNPAYRQMYDYDCARLFGESLRSGYLLDHVIDGKSLALPPPPPPVQLEAKVERITPGPYTAGDRLSAVGAVRDGQGVVRRIPGGTFRVTDASGKSTDHRGTVQPDGTVTADFTLPPTDSARVEFIPDKPPLAPGETLRTAVSEAQSLKVEVCGFRARLVQPSALAPETLVAGQATALRARLFDAAGQQPVAAPAGLSLAFTVQVEDEPTQTLAVDKELSASWTPPASPRPRQVRISAGGRAGERVVCPAGEATATVSDLGLGFDTSGLPRTCYVGLPCRGTVVLQRPSEPGVRHRVDELLLDPKVKARMEDTGDLLYEGTPRAGDRYEFLATYDTPKSASWSLVFQTPRGPVAMPTHEIRVRPRLQLELPAELDFGTVAAGTAVTQACQKLDFGRSQGAEEHRWELRAEGLEGCQARPVLSFLNALSAADVRGLVPSLGIDALDPKDRRLDICLEVPRCAGEVSPDSAVLRVVPLTPEFKAQEKLLRLRWKVESRGFLGCHGAWVWPSLALLGVGVLLAGFTQPARFPSGASIRVAGSERGMRQAAAILLLDCPGSSPGFFRDARLALHGDGEVNGRTRSAAILLRATRGSGVVLTGNGPLEMQDRRTLQWEPVTDLAQGHVPSSSALYRAGSTYFKVEL